MFEWPMWRMTIAFSLGTAIPLIDTVVPDSGGPLEGGGGAGPPTGAASVRVPGVGGAAAPPEAPPGLLPPLPPIAAGDGFPPAPPAGVVAAGTLGCARSISLTPQ